MHGVPIKFVDFLQVLPHAAKVLGHMVARGALELDALVFRHHVPLVAFNRPGNVSMENVLMEIEWNTAGQLQT